MERFDQSHKAAAYVYSRLQDDESKMIFRKRMSYAVSGDYRHIAEMPRRCFLENRVRVRDESPLFFTYMERREETVAKYAPLAILGTDGAAERFFVKWSGRGADIACFCGVEDGSFHSLPVMTAKEAIEKFPDVFIASPDQHVSALQADLLRFFPRDKLVPYDAFTDNLAVNTGGKYFDRGIIRLGSGEIFADIGAKDMETSIVFGEMCGYRYEKIYAFEPDPRCYEICRENLCFFPKGSVKLSSAALSDKVCDLPFMFHREPGNSTARQDAPNSVSAVTLDNFLSGRPVTFLKLHVEGSELAVLRGAAVTIRTHHPRIAATVCHNPSDILDIPYFILSLNPAYGLWLRHYSSGEQETVIYAV